MINAEEIDISDGRSIGIIGDSRVYPFETEEGKKVFKLFAPDVGGSPIRLFQVQRYQVLTNLAVPFAAQITTLFQTNSIKFTWEVIHIESVGERLYGRKLAPYSISPNIEGVSMDEDIKLQYILTKIAQERNIPLRGPAYVTFLDTVTNSLRNLTGELAIKLASCNIKPVERDYGYHMRITDLCARLYYIKK